MLSSIDLGNLYVKCHSIDDMYEIVKHRYASRQDFDRHVNYTIYYQYNTYDFFDPALHTIAELTNKYYAYLTMNYDFGYMQPARFNNIVNTIVRFAVQGKHDVYADDEWIDATINCQTRMFETEYKQLAFACQFSKVYDVVQTMLWHCKDDKKHLSKSIDLGSEIYNRPDVQRKIANRYALLALTVDA